MIYGATLALSNLPATAREIVTAGFTWAPDICPSVYAMIQSENQNASATQSIPITGAANIAAQQPPITNMAVQRHSALYALRSDFFIHKNLKSL